MRIVLFSVMVWLIATSAYAQSCVDPQTLLPSVVKLITRTVQGLQGTAWFFERTDQLVTVEHVVKGNLDDAWRKIELYQTEDSGVEQGEVMARVSRMVNAGFSERLVVLQLNRGFLNVRPASVRETPLTPNEPAIGVAYPNGERHVGTGWFRRFSVFTDWVALRAGYGLFDITEQGDRLPLRKGGASGGPIFDCHGRVASVFDLVPQRKEYTHIAIPTQSLAKLKQ